MRAVQYVPDIIKLQKMMLDKYDRKLSQQEALTFRVENFLKSIEDCKLVCLFFCTVFVIDVVYKGQERQECKNLIESFNKAWLLVREFVLSDG